MSANKAASTHPDAEAAAALLLDEGGNSIDAVLGGFFAAAGRDAGTLLAPVALVVTGVGRGARCIDGRALQPGVGTRRPRGLAPGQPTPDAAFAATPRSLAALAIAHTYGANKALSTLVRPAIAVARKAGAEGRAEVLSAFVSRGPRALQQSDIRHALLVAAGPSAGGTMVEEDLEEPPLGEQRALVVDLGDGTTAALPAWLGRSPEDRPGDAARREQHRDAEVLVAADAQGAVAALAWSPDPEGVLVPELQLRLPRDAAPVMRGVPRVAPNTPRPCALPLVGLARPSDSFYAAIGVGGRADLGQDEVRLDENGLPGLLERLADVQRGALAVAASVTRGKVVATRVGGRR